MKIPGAKRAVVDAAKVRDYLLSPEHRVGSAKARFFAQLGFEQRNWTILQHELPRFATQEAAGRVAPLVVVWTVLNGEDFPCFVTAYPGAKS